MDHTLCGDYRLPNLLPTQEEEYDIGIYGQRYFRYIKTRTSYKEYDCNLCSFIAGTPLPKPARCPQIALQRPFRQGRSVFRHRCTYHLPIALRIAFRQGIP